MNEEQANKTYKIINKRRIPFRYFFDILKILKKSWDWKPVMDESASFEYNLRVLYSYTNKMMRLYNFISLAVDKEKGTCEGFNMAYIAGNARAYHPFLFIINKTVKFLLLFSAQGRKLRKEAIMIEDYLYFSNCLGLYAYAGVDCKKTSLGICVAVNPEYRKRGLYKDMLKIMFEKITGVFLFQTSTDCDYHAHEKTGFKLLCTMPRPLNEGQSFIMYGDKSIFVKNPI